MAWLRYQSQNHSPSQGQEHGHLLPLERRFPIGHASVTLLEYALMALLSTLVIIFQVLYFPGNFANGNQKGQPGIHQICAKL